MDDKNNLDFPNSNSSSLGGQQSLGRFNETTPLQNAGNASIGETSGTQISPSAVRSGNISYNNQAIVQDATVASDVDSGFFDFSSSSRPNVHTSMQVSDETKKLDFGNQSNSDTDSVNSQLPYGDKKKASRGKKLSIKKILFRTACCLLGLLIGVVGFMLWYSSFVLGHIEYLESQVSVLDENGNTIFVEDLMEDTDNELIVDEAITNFLLIGIDSRSSGYSDDGTGALADVIMILSVDNENGTIKLVSIARDSYVYVPGYSDPCKINAAMNYGGPELLMATVTNNFRIELDGYAYINFHKMADVIDAVGGVYVNASSSEVYGEGGLNTNLAEINAIDGLAPSYQAVGSTGDIWVNGRQAVAYARIRYIGNGDYERSTRQVEVLRSLLAQFMSLSLTDKAIAVSNILSLISTNISEEDIRSYAIDFLPSLDNLEMQYLQLPFEGFFNSGIYGDEWSIRGNWNMMIPYVQEFLYGYTVEFDEVELPPYVPEDSDCPSFYDWEANLK